MKKVNYEKLDREIRKIQNQVREEAWKLPCGNVEICDNTDYLDTHIVDLKINWGCSGSQSIEDTMAFAKVLNMAIELVKSFPYNGYKIDYGYED